MKDKILELNKTLTQDQIAKELGLTKGEINWILHGKERRGKIYDAESKLCPITGFPVSERYKY